MDDRATIGSKTTPRCRERVMTLAVVGLVHLAVLVLLMAYSPDRRQRIADQTMQLITLRPPAAPSRPASRPSEPHKASAPPVKRSSPPPKPAALPAPVAIAVAADTNLSASVGSGSSLAGLGLGNGDLGGGSGGLSRHAEWVGGGLSDRDYPEAAKRARLQGVVDVRFIVRPDGRVEGCKVDHSSGSADLDRLTCALTEQRLLYNPALDAAGKPVEEVSGRRFRFVMGRRPRS